MSKNIEVEGYLDKVCSRVKFARSHRGLRKEIRYHIDDQMNDYIKEGLDKDKATIKAIEEMGDPIVVGEGLNKIHRPQTDWITIGLVSLLMIFGIYILISLKNANQLKIHEIRNHLKYMGIGLVLVAGLYFFDYSRLEKYSYLTYGIGILMMLYSIRQSFVIGRFGVDPSVMASFFSAILFILGFSGIIERPHEPSIKELIKIMIMAVIPITLYMMGNRKFIIAISIGICFLWLIVNSIKKGRYGENKKNNYVLVGGFLTLVGVVVGMNLSEMMLNRITSFSPGYGDILGNGWIYYVIRSQLSGSKAFGQNVIESDMSIFKTLPGLKFDYIFTYIITSLGWVAGFIIIGVCLLMIIRLMKMTGKLKHKFGYNIAISIIIFLGIQFAVAILGNLALIPATLTYGLPFVSLGGASLLGNMILVGLLLSIWRNNNIIVDSEPLAKRYEIIIRKLNK